MESIMHNYLTSPVHLASTRGPPIIGGKARWKFLKICVLCMDKISKISPEMFRLEQAYIEKTKMCLDCPSGPPKCQICSDWPQNCHFCLKYTNKQCHNSFPVHPISIGTHCAWLPSAFPLCSYNSFYCLQNILKFPLQLIEELYLCLFDGECTAILAECWCCGQDVKKSIRQK